MNKVEISREYIVTGAEHSSMGSQMKWQQDGYWYKADSHGFESLAETVAAHLLQHSNIDDFIEYEPVMIDYKGRTYRGCRSKNFKKENEELITLERLAKNYTGFGLAHTLKRIGEAKERILYTVELVENITGLESFGVYLTKMLEIDAFFLNEGRNTDNIMLLYDVQKREYRPAPYFDMGYSLFSDTKGACPPEKGMVECYSAITAKPFSAHFDEQMKAANELFGTYLRFDLSPKEMINAVRDMLNNISTQVRYEDVEKRRIGEIFRFQTKKYQDRFKN